MLNPIFSKKVQGQKYPGRWGIVKHQIPSTKVLFKTNTKGHKHPSIRLLSKCKTQLVDQRKQKVAFSPGTAHSPEIQSYRTWWGAASPILNDTPVVYTSYNRTHIRNMHTHTHTHTHIYIYIYIRGLAVKLFAPKISRNMPLWTYRTEMCILANVIGSASVVSTNAHNIW